MSETVETVFHVLSVRREESGSAVRGTIRRGQVEPGQSLRFQTPSGTRHVVRVEGSKAGPRHWTLHLAGSSADLDALRRGFYLFDDPACGGEAP